MARRRKIRCPAELPVDRSGIRNFVGRQHVARPEHELAREVYDKAFAQCRRWTDCPPSVCEDWARRSGEHAREEHGRNRREYVAVMYPGRAYRREYFEGARRRR